MKTIYLIGMGPGGPEYLTIQAIETLKRVDVFFMLDKEGRGKDELIRMRQAVLRHYLGDDGYRVVAVTSPVRRSQPGGYKDDVRVWHEEKYQIFERLIADELQDNQSGALLLWGDPSLYDQTVSLVSELVENSQGALDFEVIPGITSVQMLTAKHKIPLNRVGESVMITTGRHVEHCDPAEIQNAVVMLDYNASFQRFKGQNMDVYWGGYLGFPDEMIAAGPVDEISDDLIKTKAEARDRKGWLMDLYLLRRRKTDDS